MEVFEFNHASTLLLLCQLYLWMILITANEVSQLQNPSNSNICRAHPCMDIVILMDRSCPMTLTQCQSIQQLISDTLLPIPKVSLYRGIPRARIAYLEYGTGNDIEVIINLIQNPYNSGGVLTQQDIDRYANIIKSRCDNFDELSLMNRQGEPNINLAIHNAVEQFGEADSANYHETKILIFSNCQTKNINIDTICNYK